MWAVCSTHPVLTGILFDFNETMADLQKLQEGLPSLRGRMLVQPCDNSLLQRETKSKIQSSLRSQQTRQEKHCIIIKQDNVPPHLKLCFCYKRSLRLPMLSLETNAFKAKYWKSHCSQFMKYDQCLDQQFWVSESTICNL